MASCPQSAPAPFRCPTPLESIQATAALLPRGRAWPVNDGGATIARFLVWLAGLSGAPASWPAGFVQAGVIAAIGAVRNWVEGRFCALLEEFWCATASETLDLWNKEYGLPDGCDPFPNLCVKVGAFGEPRCDHWVTLAATLGWSIACGDFRQSAGAMADCAFADNALAASGVQASVINISVFLADSAAYTSILSTPPLADLMQADMQITCLPDITPLICAFDRIMPAHLTVNYLVD